MTPHQQQTLMRLSLLPRVERGNGQEPEPERMERNAAPSSLDSISTGVLSGFGMLGNLLDLPGSMVRDVASTLSGDWENPFDQLLDPLSHSETGSSISGRDLSTRWGVAENKETGIAGWWDDPLEAGRDIGSFALEMGLDPLSWLSGGLSVGANIAVKASGRIGRAAGKLGRVADKIDPGFHVGRAAVQHTAGGKATLKAAKAAPGAIKRFVQGSAAYRAAVQSSAGQWVEKARDVGKGALDPSTEGHIVPVVQSHIARVRKAVDEEMMDRLTMGIQNLNAQILKEFPGSKLEDNIVPIQKALSRGVETDDWTGVTPAMFRAVKRVVADSDGLHVAMHDAGVDVKWLQDNVIEFSPRQMNHNLQALAKESRIRKPGQDAAAKGLGQREDILRGGSTQDWNALTSDEAIHNALETFADDNGEAAAELMRIEYGDVIDGRLPIESNGMWTVKDANGKTSKTPANPALYNIDYGDSFDADIIIRSPGVDGSPPMEFTLEWKDKFREVAKYLAEDGGSRDLIEAGGIFSNQLVAQYTKRGATQLRFLQEILDTPAMFKEANSSGYLAAGEVAKRADGGPGLEQGASGLKLGDIFKEGTMEGVSKDKIYSKWADIDPEIDAIRQGHETNGDFITEMDGWKMDPGMYAALEGRAAIDSEKAVSVLANMFNSATTLFKAGVLIHPARAGRDLFGAVVNNLANERLTLKGLWAAKKVATNQDAKDLLDLPEVQQWMIDMSLPGLKVKLDGAGKKVSDGIADADVAAKSATEAMRRKYAAARTDTATVARNQPGVKTGLQDVESFGDVVDFRPGMQQSRKGIRGHLLDQWDTFRGRSAGTTWKPWAVSGLPTTGIDGRKVIRRHSDFFLGRMSEAAVKLTDDWGRLSGVISGMEKGESFKDAFDATMFAQVNYSPANLTPFLRNVKTVMPFLTFDNGMVRFLAHKLATDPTGLHGKMIRAQHRVEDKTAPEYVRNTGGIRLYDDKEGNSHYLTSLGMMHSAIVDRMGDGTPRGALRGVASGVSPYIKGVAEAVTGRSVFRDKALADLDPPMGRIARNLKSHFGYEVPGGKAKPLFGSHNLEFIVSNSPATRVIGTIKKLTDTRRSFFLDAAEQLTGVGRMSTVSPWMREREKAHQLEKLAKELGVTSFTLTNVGEKDVMAASNPESKRILETIREYQSEQRRIRRQRR